MNKSSDMIRNRAGFGFSAFKNLSGKLPNLFPRIMGPNAMKYLQEVIESGLESDMVERFETVFKEKMGMRYCVSAPGCSNAIYSLAEAMQLKPGDEVVVSSVSDYGTIMGFCKMGVIPVFADTAKNSINVCAETIEACITEKTRAIMVVHMTGLVCDMDPILSVAEKYHLPVIEDVCQAIMSTYKGRLAGTLGYASSFSFDSEKIMGSDIGACYLTNDQELYDFANFFCLSRAGTMKPGYGRMYVMPGIAMRMPQCTAAVNLAQLELLDSNVKILDKQIRYLYKLLSSIDGISVELPKDYQSVFACWMGVFRVDLSKFDCTLDEFCKECVEMGFTGLGALKYYLLPESCTFLADNAAEGNFPYMKPFTEKEYDYRCNLYPNAVEYLSNALRWATFSERYTEKDCDLVYDIVKTVATRHYR
ncbi:MAG: DegT/DnrJ/EryC1/StrS family aminotransferase [Bacillota bacterium]